MSQVLDEIGINLDEQLVNAPGQKAQVRLALWPPAHPPPCCLRCCPDVLRCVPGAPFTGQQCGVAVLLQRLASVARCQMGALIVHCRGLKVRKEGRTLLRLQT